MKGIQHSSISLSGYDDDIREIILWRINIKCRENAMIRFDALLILEEYKMHLLPLLVSRQLDTIIMFLKSRGIHFDLYRLIRNN